MQGSGQLRQDVVAVAKIGGAARADWRTRGRGSCRHPICLLSNQHLSNAIFCFSLHFSCCQHAVIKLRPVDLQDP